MPHYKVQSTKRTWFYHNSQSKDFPSVDSNKVQFKIEFIQRKSSSGSSIALKISIFWDWIKNTTFYWHLAESKAIILFKMLLELKIDDNQITYSPFFGSSVLTDWMSRHQQCPSAMREKTYTTNDYFKSKVHFIISSHNDQLSWIINKLPDHWDDSELHTQGRAIFHLLWHLFVNIRTHDCAQGDSHSNYRMHTNGAFFWCFFLFNLLRSKTWMFNLRYPECECWPLIKTLLFYPIGKCWA